MDHRKKRKKIGTIVVKEELPIPIHVTYVRNRLPITSACEHNQAHTLYSDLFITVGNTVAGRGGRAIHAVLPIKIGLLPPITAHHGTTTLSANHTTRRGVLILITLATLNIGCPGGWVAGPLHHRSYSTSLLRHPKQTIERQAPMNIQAYTSPTTSWQLDPCTEALRPDLCVSSQRTRTIVYRGSSTAGNIEGRGYVVVRISIRSLSQPLPGPEHFHLLAYTVCSMARLLGSRWYP
ncbi:hypothetical protein J6590_023611 [Homalodisca vitripennis]|nr:hypothetical protein J6590_023611 [Homalodisca vitripennis]